jgi:superfamily II DNA helicase RecQ
MKVQFFSINALEPDADQTVIDQFCTAHRVISIEKHLLQQADSAYWSICITYLDTSQSLSKNTSHPIDKKSQIDYREVLNSDDFSLYVTLRERRKTMAEKEGVPVFALFTNAQLAMIVTERITSLSQLSKIEGVGKIKRDKYGTVFLTLLKEELKKQKK